MVEFTLLAIVLVLGVMSLMLTRVSWVVETIQEQTRRTLKQEAKQVADLDEILAKVRAQRTVIDGIATFIADLKAHQNDPAKLAEIVAEVDANTLATDLLDGVEGPPPTP